MAQHHIVEVFRKLLWSLNLSSLNEVQSGSRLSLSIQLAYSEYPLYLNIVRIKILEKGVDSVLHQVLSWVPKPDGVGAQRWGSLYVM